MKTSEEAIRKVLAGLQACDPPPEMERRIQKTLQDRASRQSRSGWSWLRSTWQAAPAAPLVPRPSVLGVALAGMLAVAFTIPFLYRAHRAGGAAGQLEMIPSSVKPSLAMAGQVVSPSPARPPAQAARSPVKRQERRVAVVRHNDSLAWRELRDDSRPAPPLPLTGEEMMLLRVVRKAAPGELAMLNPEVRAKQEADSNAEFQRFFGQVTAKQDQH